MKAFSSMKRYLKLSSKVLEKLEIKIVLFILRHSNCTGFQIEVVVEKAKGRISKRMLREKKVRQIFQKTDISYPLISTCA